VVPGKVAQGAAELVESEIAPVVARARLGDVVGGQRALVCRNRLLPEGGERPGLPGGVRDHDGQSTIAPTTVRVSGAERRP
jgi:hypothetical protein